MAKIRESAIWDYENLAMTKDPAAEVYIYCWLSTVKGGYIRMKHIKFIWTIHSQ